MWLIGSFSDFAVEILYKKLQCRIVSFKAKFVKIEFSGHILKYRGIAKQDNVDVFVFRIDTSWRSAGQSSQAWQFGGLLKCTKKIMLLQKCTVTVTNHCKY